MSGKHCVFKTDRRIKLGLWGLGRGMSFSDLCRDLNMDVVAGCDHNPHMRDRFALANPSATVTDNAETFLAMDFDAVLLATFCPNHAEDAIRCLEAGKHVLSEVTAFHTMAEGVRLVEAVERSGLVYNMAENYPFTPEFFDLEEKWRTGLMGDLQYAECEYVHECRAFAYTYIDGLPIQPGNTVHNWRSWQNFHYYCTHSLGPVMYVTGLRPTRVFAYPEPVTLPGYPVSGNDGMGGMTPSLLTMNNGAVVRNLMGASTNDTHQFRFWGTCGAAEVHPGLTLRLGAAGAGLKMAVRPLLPVFAELAQKAGHGGGDFWTLYYFARQILEGIPAPFDVYRSADCTIPGIQAYRATQMNGVSLEIPDFRSKSERDKWRHDDFAQRRFPVDKGCFPKKSDPALTGRFTAIVATLLKTGTAYRSFSDWYPLIRQCAEPARLLALGERILTELPAFQEAVEAAQTLSQAYPRSVGAKVLREILEVARQENALDRNLAVEIGKRCAAIRKRTKTH